MDFGLGVLLDAKDMWSGTFSRAGASFRQFEGATSEAGKRITDNLKLLGVGMTMLGAGLGGLALLDKPLDAAARFGVEIGQIRTIIDETALSTARAEDAVFDLAAAYGGGPIKQANALYETISAGITDAAKATDLLAVANEFAIGGNAELKAGVDVLTSSLNTYADKGLTARDASDALFVAIAAGKTTAAELSQSLGEVAPTAHALGVSFDELTATVAALTVQGIKTPQAITGLNAMLANIVKPSKDATAEAARLGIQFNATALKTLGLTGVLAQLSNNAKVNDDTFVNLFGSIDGIKSALALTADGGAKMGEVLDQMKGKAGATKKAFDIMAETLDFQKKRFDGLKENALVVIGQALEPMAARTVAFASTMVEAFMRIPAPIRDFLTRAFVMVSVLLSIVGAGIAVKAAIGVLSAGLAAAGVSLGGFLVTALPVVAVLGAIAAGFLAFREAYDRNLGGLGTTVDRLFDKVRLVGQGLAQAFTDGGFSGAVRDELNAADNAGIKNFVIRVFVAVERIKELFSRIADGFFDAINEGWPVFQEFMEAVDGLAQKFGGLFAAIDPGESSAKFDSFGNAGRKIGVVLAKVALLLVEGATAFVKLLTAMAPLASAAGTVIDKLGGVEAIAKVLELALFALAARSVLTAAFNLGQLGASGVTAAAGMAKIVAQTVALNGMSFASVGAGLATGLKGITTAVTGALGPIGALTFALTSLYAAYNVFSELDKESKGQGWSNWWNNALHKVGIRDDYEHGKRRAELLGTDKMSQQELAEKLYGYKPSDASVVAPPGGEAAAPPPEIPAAAAVVPAGPSASDLYATVAAAAKQEPPTVVLNAKVLVDGDELMTKVESVSTERANRSFTPGIPVAQ